jgi:hypothetical protein
MQEFKNAGIDPNKLVFNAKNFGQTCSYLLANTGKLVKNRKKILAATFKLASYLKQIRSTPKASAQFAFDGLDSRFEAHRKFADKAWFKWRKQFIFTVLKYQERLGDKQLTMLESIYEPVASITTMFCAIAASRAAAASGDKATVAALNLLCLEMRCKLAGEKTHGQSIRKSC